MSSSFSSPYPLFLQQSYLSFLLQVHQQLHQMAGIYNLRKYHFFNFLHFGTLHYGIWHLLQLISSFPISMNGLNELFWQVVVLRNLHYLKIHSFLWSLHCWVGLLLLECRRLFLQLYLILLGLFLGMTSLLIPQVITIVPIAIPQIFIFKLPVLFLFCHLFYQRKF